MIAKYLSTKGMPETDELIIKTIVNKVLNECAIEYLRL